MNIMREALNNMERRYRATFINSLAGYRQAVLVGTRSGSGCSNLAVFNSLMHIGADPALYGLLFRPDRVRRDTLSNILETGSYTLNYMRSADYVRMHHCSAKFDADISEFDAVGLTEEHSSAGTAPFVAEAAVKIALSFQERLDIKSNGTILIIGRLEQIVLNELEPGPDGFVKLEQADVTACAGLDAYFSLRLIGRLSYAVPDAIPHRIDLP